MSGWQQQIDVGQPYVPPKGVIGIVVAQKFPDPEAIRTTLEDGLARVAPDTVWVMREQARANHAVTFAWRTFAAHDIEPLLAPLTPYWDSRFKPRRVDVMRDVHDDNCEQEHLVFTEFVEGGGRDQRADYRDIEMRATCERIIVFHDKSSNITAEWLDYRTNGMSTAKIYVVERGKVKVKKYRKGRKPD